jgi:hypothetical protein
VARQELVSRLEPRVFIPGDVILAEGDLTRLSMFLIERGDVDLYAARAGMKKLAQAQEALLDQLDEFALAASEDDRGRRSSGRSRSGRPVAAAPARRNSKPLDPPPEPGAAERRTFDPSAPSLDLRLASADDGDERKRSVRRRVLAREEVVRRDGRAEDRGHEGAHGFLRGGAGVWGGRFGGGAERREERSKAAIDRKNTGGAPPRGERLSGGVG